MTEDQETEEVLKKKETGRNSRDTSTRVGDEKKDSTRDVL